MRSDASRDRPPSHRLLVLLGVRAGGNPAPPADARPARCRSFSASVLAILPLAALIGHATESLADRLGGGIGGLLNATFGNAAELIIGVLALREGLTDLVKASLTGSIIGNVLLVFGACGARRRPAPPGAALQPHRRRPRHDDAAAQRDRADRARRSSTGCRADLPNAPELSSTPRSRSSCS